MGSTTVVKIHVDQVSGTGKGIKEGDVWFNRAGKAQFSTFSSQLVGQTIEADVQYDDTGKGWIRSFTVVVEGAKQEAIASPAPVPVHTAATGRPSMRVVGMDVPTQRRITYLACLGDTVAEIVKGTINSSDVATGTAAAKILAREFANEAIAFGDALPPMMEGQQNA